MRNIFKFVFAASLLISCPLFAFPDEERATLEDLVNSQATDMILDADDRFLYLASGDDIVRMDTQTWGLATEQVPALTDQSDSGGDDLTGNISGLALQGDTLFAAQADGDLLTIDLNNITGTPETTEIITGTLGFLVADTEGGSDDDKLYLLDKTNNAVIVFDVSSESQTSILLTGGGTGGTTTTAPVALILVPFPTAASTATTDKVFVTTNEGKVFVINEGGTAVGNVISLSTTNKNLPQIAASPNGNFVFVVNSSDSTVHVMDTSTETEVDTDPNTAGTNPIALAPNTQLNDVGVTSVSSPTDVYAFVTGSSGVSIVDLNLGVTSFGTPDLIDFQDEGTSDDEDNPLEPPNAPGRIVASSVEDGYVFTSNGNADISVVSNNPFVTISATSLGTNAFTTSGSFTLTFQSDEAGTYSVRVGGDHTVTGTEVTSGSVATADTDVTTAEISYNASTFSEGTDRVFVFVTDSAGNVGRDAVDITVDTPPPGIEMTETGFGREKITVTFNRLTDSDIDYYNVYVDTTIAAALASTTVSTTVDQPSSGAELTATVAGLTNGVTYFIAVEAVDTSGNVGTRTTALTTGAVASSTPEETVGIAGVTGEAGCSLLVPSRPAGGMSWTLLLMWLGAPFFLSLVRHGRKLFNYLILLLFFMCLLFPSLSFAKEDSPEWWSLELKSGIWMPMDATTKSFFGACCEPTGNVEFGFLYQSKYGFELGAGYIGASGQARGAASGLTSADRFSFTMIPIQNNFTFRADFKEDQRFVPYAKLGLDYVYFRENVQGTVTNGLKLGLHTAGGLQILIDDHPTDWADGLNELYFTLEGRYGWINGFGGSGIDLSHLTFAGGFLFEF